MRNEYMNEDKTIAKVVQMNEYQHLNLLDILIKEKRFVTKENQTEDEELKRLQIEINFEKSKIIIQIQLVE